MFLWLKRVVWILPYIFVFIASLYLPTDPDLGWHLKYGEYFFQHHQILRDNTFSTMMPQYHWENGSWGTDIITYAIYKLGGFGGPAPYLSRRAQVAELVDALVSGTSAHKAWRFESSPGHQRLYFIVCHCSSYFINTHIISIC